MVAGGLASVHVENFSGHESRRVQVHDSIDDLRYFTAAAVRKPLRIITGKAYEIPHVVLSTGLGAAV